VGQGKVLLAVVVVTVCAFLAVLVLIGVILTSFVVVAIAICVVVFVVICILLAAGVVSVFDHLGQGLSTTEAAAYVVSWWHQEKVT